jgi:hypothetical protein
MRTLDNSARDITTIICIYGISLLKKLNPTTTRALLAKKVILEAGEQTT